MKARPVDELVYETLFPKPKPSDPPDFQALLTRHLVIEVRNETAAFYGNLDTREAQYPGLDYSFRPHRQRLSRFTWHRRLFRAFDALGLTPSEIANLTKWEGTKWAKDRFEKESGELIRDTTGDCIKDWVEPSLRDREHARREDHTSQNPLEDSAEHMQEIYRVAGQVYQEDGILDESDIEIESVGLDLNARLLARAAQREAGDASAVMDEELEQWMKDAAEAGEIPFLAEQGFESFLRRYDSSRQSSSSSSSLAPPNVATIPTRYLVAAQMGRWHEIPEFLCSIIRQVVEDAGGLRRIGVPGISRAIQDGVSRPETQVSTVQVHSSSQRHPPLQPQPFENSGLYSPPRRSRLRNMTDLSESPEVASWPSRQSAELSESHE